ncbi:hypothetical protein C8K30_1011086 [Promicromonospora sp. AC04]|uniref:hypothetical protein n=1 Tax=Promicromonospora sp. AC04 TaxID=2135723 RepID=UPI000D4530FF|nr:hypothetical protein [Promicromonospora sp. AC04]PUB32560.1 hypothetical protein C8K30_1011086 [Promicromonospora sp. AC04]
MAARSDDETRRNQWTAQYTSIVLDLPDRLADFLEALQSSDPDAALMALFDCDAAMALQLRRTQFDFLTTQRRAQMHRDLELLREANA